MLWELWKPSPSHRPSQIPCGWLWSPGQGNCSKKGQQETTGLYICIDGPGRDIISWGPTICPMWWNKQHHFAYNTWGSIDRQGSSPFCFSCVSLGKWSFLSLSFLFCNVEIRLLPNSQSYSRLKEKKLCTVAENMSSGNASYAWLSEPPYSFPTDLSLVRTEMTNLIYLTQ